MQTGSRLGLICGVVLFGMILFISSAELRADQIELLSGSSGTGKVVSRNEKVVLFEMKVSGRTVKRSIPVNRIHAVTIDGTRTVINPMLVKPGATAGRRTGTSLGTKQNRSPQTGTVPTSIVRTPNEIQAIIAGEGSTPPEWLESTPLDYPSTLDLSFPQQPGDWNNQRNVGQFVWDIVNPNQNRWRSGVKLCDHLLAVNRNNPNVVRRVMIMKGEFFFKFFQDYARAAYCWQQAGVHRNPNDTPYVAACLAECYFRLGCKPMAMALLKQTRPDMPQIKIYSDMGELELALKVAEMHARGSRPDFAYIYAGDACRTAGQFDRAIAYYQKVLQVPELPNRTADNMLRNTKRARANIIGINAFEKLDLNRVPDGIYEGDSVGFAGQLYLKVTVMNHRITSVVVTKHQEKQYYSSVIDIPRQIVERQSLKNIDAVTSATATSEAIVNATAKALLGAYQN